MKRLLPLIAFFRSLPNRRIQMDGEALMAYGVVATMGAAGCIGGWNYAWYLIDQGQTLQGGGLIALTVAVGLCLLLPPLFYEPSKETASGMDGEFEEPEPIEAEANEPGRNF